MIDFSEKIYCIKETFCSYLLERLEEQTIGIYSIREVAENEMRHIITDLVEYHKRNDTVEFDRATPKGDLNNVRFQTPHGFVVYEIVEVKINSRIVKHLNGYDI